MEAADAIKRRLVNALFVAEVKDVGFLDAEGKAELIADLDLVDERDAGDEVDATEVGVDVIFVTEQLSDGDFDFIGLAKSGVLVLVSVMDVFRTDSQNDRLTCKEARKTDVWLHTKDITGSHVIISCPEPPEGAKFTPDELPPDRTIEEAAMIAAYNSKGRNSSRVDVDYTFVKFVKKPAGSKPGMVIFTHNYTITVKPDEDIVKSLEV